MTITIHNSSITVTWQLIIASHCTVSIAALLVLQRWGHHRLLPLSKTFCSLSRQMFLYHLHHQLHHRQYLQLRLNQDLENAHNWLRVNKLTLNMTKTEFMFIWFRLRLSTLTESPTFAINDFQVSQVTTVKSFGVTIDDRHDWSGHIEKLTRNVASGIGAIKRIRHPVPQAALLLIYLSLMQPRFHYCNIVWGKLWDSVAE